MWSIARTSSKKVYLHIVRSPWYCTIYSQDVESVSDFYLRLNVKAWLSIITSFSFTVLKSWRMERTLMLLKFLLFSLFACWNHQFFNCHLRNLNNRVSRDYHVWSDGVMAYSWTTVERSKSSIWSKIERSKCSASQNTPVVVLILVFSWLRLTQSFTRIWYFQDGFLFRTFLRTKSKNNNITFISLTRRGIRRNLIPLKFDPSRRTHSRLTVRQRRLY